MTESIDRRYTKAQRFRLKSNGDVIIARAIDIFNPGNYDVLDGMTPLFIKHRPRWDKITFVTPESSKDLICVNNGVGIEPKDVVNIYAGNLGVDLGEFMVRTIFEKQKRYDVLLEFPSICLEENIQLPYWQKTDFWKPGQTMAQLVNLCSKNEKGAYCGWHFVACKVLVSEKVCQVDVVDTYEGTDLKKLEECICKFVRFRLGPNGQNYTIFCRVMITDSYQKNPDCLVLSVLNIAELLKRDPNIDLHARPRVLYPDYVMNEIGRLRVNVSALIMLLGSIQGYISHPIFDTIRTSEKIQSEWVMPIMVQDDERDSKRARTSPSTEPAPAMVFDLSSDTGPVQSSNVGPNPSPDAGSAGRPSQIDSRFDLWQVEATIESEVSFDLRKYVSDKKIWLETFGINVFSVVITSNVMKKYQITMDSIEDRKKACKNSDMATWDVSNPPIRVTFRRQPLGFHRGFVGTGGRIVKINDGPVNLEECLDMRDFFHLRLENHFMPQLPRRIIDFINPIYFVDKSVLDELKRPKTWASGRRVSLEDCFFFSSPAERDDFGFAVMAKAFYAINSDDFACLTNGLMNQCIDSTHTLVGFIALLLLENVFPLRFPREVKMGFDLTVYSGSQISRYDGPGKRNWTCDIVLLLVNINTRSMKHWVAVRVDFPQNKVEVMDSLRTSESIKKGLGGFLRTFICNSILPSRIDVDKMTLTFTQTSKQILNSCGINAPITLCYAALGEKIDWDMKDLKTVLENLRLIIVGTGIMQKLLEPRTTFTERDGKYARIRACALKVEGILYNSRLKTWLLSGDADVEVRRFDKLDSSVRGVVSETAQHLAAHQ